MICLVGRLEGHLIRNDRINRININIPCTKCVAFPYTRISEKRGNCGNARQRIVLYRKEKLCHNIAILIIEGCRVSNQLVERLNHDISAAQRILAQLDGSCQGNAVHRDDIPNTVGHIARGRRGNFYRRQGGIFHCVSARVYRLTCHRKGYIVRNRSLLRNHNDILALCGKRVSAPRNISHIPLERIVLKRKHGESCGKRILIKIKERKGQSKVLNRCSVIIQESNLKDRNIHLRDQRKIISCGNDLSVGHHKGSHRRCRAKHTEHHDALQAEIVLVDDSIAISVDIPSIKCISDFLGNRKLERAVCLAIFQFKLEILGEDRLFSLGIGNRRSVSDLRVDRIDAGNRLSTDRKAFPSNRISDLFRKCGNFRRIKRLKSLEIVNRFNQHTVSIEIYLPPNLGVKQRSILGRHDRTLGNFKLQVREQLLKDRKIHSRGQIEDMRIFRGILHGQLINSLKGQRRIKSSLKCKRVAEVNQQVHRSLLGQTELLQKRESLLVILLGNRSLKAEALISLVELGKRFVRKLHGYLSFDESNHLVAKRHQTVYARKCIKQLIRLRLGNGNLFSLATKRRIDLCISLCANDIDLFRNRSDDRRKILFGKVGQERCKLPERNLARNAQNLFLQFGRNTRGKQNLLVNFCTNRWERHLRDDIKIIADLPNELICMCRGKLLKLRKVSDKFDGNAKLILGSPNIDAKNPFCQRIALLHCEEGVDIGNRLKQSNNNRFEIKITRVINARIIDVNRSDLGVQEKQEAIHKLLHKRLVLRSLAAKQSQKIRADLSEIDLLQHSSVGQKRLDLRNANRFKNTLELRELIPRKKLAISLCRSRNVTKGHKVKQTVIADRINNLVDREIVKQRRISADDSNHFLLIKISVLDHCIISAERRNDLIAIEICKEFRRANRANNRLCVVFQKLGTKILPECRRNLRAAYGVENIFVNLVVFINKALNRSNSDHIHKRGKFKVIPIISKRELRIVVNRIGNDGSCRSIVQKHRTKLRTISNIRASKYSAILELKNQLLGKDSFKELIIAKQSVNKRFGREQLFKHGFIHERFHLCVTEDSADVSFVDRIRGNQSVNDLFGHERIVYRGHILKKLKHRRIGQEGRHNALFAVKIIFECRRCRFIGKNIVKRRRTVYQSQQLCFVRFIRQPAIHHRATDKLSKLFLKRRVGKNCIKNILAVQKFFQKFVGQNLIFCRLIEQ